MTDRFIAQSGEYQGTPTRIATFYDTYDEYHVVIEMVAGGYTYYLDWIGGDYAPEPDEDDTPPDQPVSWRAVTPPKGAQ